MRSIRFLLTLAALLLLVVPDAGAQNRTYAGMFTSGWKTLGVHGHDQPWCAPRRSTEIGHGVFHESANCDAIDFARGNLDNNIGFRSGLERDFLRVGRLSIVGGVDGSLSHTEYNLSQADFIFATATALGGADLRFGDVTIGGRVGAGVFGTTDGAEYGFQRTGTAHITLPLRPGVGIRIGRHFVHAVPTQKAVNLYGAGSSALQPVLVSITREPYVVETSFLLVASPEYLGSSEWEFSTATGATTPGGPVGSSRMLRTSNYNQTVAARRLPWRGLEARIAWTAAAHESIRPTIFKGFDNNYRSKTINALGVSLGTATPRFFDRLSFRYGGGIEVADWRDEHHLLTRDGEALIAGVETAMVAHGAVRWHLDRNLALEASFEKAYWRGIDLGENRIAFGIAVTR